MTPMPRRVLRLPWRSPRRIHDDVDDELQFHCEMRTRELVERGMPEADARRLALREFGDMDALRRSCAAEDERAERADRRAAWVEDLRHDLTHAARALRRTPGVAVLTAITLALGIGANTAIFSVVRRVLLASLPYEDPGALVRVYGSHADRTDERGQISPADFIDLRARQRSLQSMAALAYRDYVLTGQGEPRRFVGARVSVNMFDVLGVRPVLGRAFRAGEDAAGSDPVVILSHAAWQGAFGGDRSVVGRRVDLNGTRYTVIGIMPAGFVWPEYGAELWTPLDLSPVLRDEHRARKFHFLGAIGRAKPGVSVDAAAVDLLAIARRLEREYPESNTNILVSVVPLRDAIVGRVRPALVVLMAAAALVLLIACANVAGILLSRTAARRPELAIRAALGAGRGRLVRQLLAESLVVAALGGALALPLAYWGTAALARLASDVLPKLGPVRVDAAVLLFAVAATLASGLLFGAAPAVVGTRAALNETLREEGRSATGSAGRLWLRRALVTGQMALAVMLLVGAGLLVKSLMHLRRVDLGFDASRLVTFEVGLPGAKYDTPEKEDQFFAALLGGLRTIPGVVAVGAAGSIPLVGGSSASLAIRGGERDPAKLPEVGYTPVSDDYFRTFRIPVRRGRVFDGRERNDGPGAVVISEGAAKQYWPGRDPIGTQVRLGPNPNDPWNTVVGMVGDVRQQGIAADPRPTVYVSHRQDHWGFARVVIRTVGAPSDVVGSIRRELREVDPAIPLVGVRTMDEIVAGDLAGTRLPMLLMSGFALLALVLAAVGVYGVMAYAVVSRTREFGVRMALGALPRNVLGLVLRQEVVASLAGVALGAAAAAAGTRLLTKLLYGVEPLDLPTFAIAAVTLVVTTLVACYVPARRATRVDPVIALRSE